MNLWHLESANSAMHHVLSDLPRKIMYLEIHYKYRQLPFASLICI